MRFFVTSLCIIIFHNHVFAQSNQETNSTGYSPWSVNAFSMIMAESDQLDQGGLLSSHNYVGGNYRIDSNQRLALKFAFNANTNGHDRFNDSCVQSQNAETADPFFEYNQYDVGIWPGVVDLFWSGRVYFPLSKSSRTKQMIAAYRSNAIFSRYITQNMFIEYRNDFRFYHQSKTTYVGSHTNDECQIEPNQNPSNTKQYRLDNWVNLWYRFNPKLSLGFNAKLRDEGYNRTSAYDTSRQRNGRMLERSLSMGPAIRYNYSFNLSFILNFMDKVEYSGFHPDRQDSFSELGQFQAKNTEITLLSFIRF